uniref:DENN domain-containing protein 5A-like n=1 Tax=Phallusia mammillata TaxID=59560 RepID=A0A6F9DBM3_9ASCI|nr:DENN domain-containing protein 5A-like [Phallusia mammillata]
MVVHQPEIQNLSKEMNRFIDYFFTCGLSEDEKPTLYRHFEDPVSPETHREKRLNSSVLTHFPTNLPDNPWNSAELWKLCTPGGLTIEIGDLPPRGPHFHSFIITREDATRSYGHALTFFEPCVNPTLEKEITDLMFLEKPEGKKIFVEKCIGLITQLGWVRTCEKVLTTLYRMFVSEAALPSTSGTTLPMESYIYNLLYEVPLLTPGCSLKIACFGHDDPLIVQQPDSSELPLLDINLTEVVHLVGGAKNLMTLVTSVLLEHQILLVSKDSQRMMTVAEGITSLLFPFQWQHTNVTVLPYELATHFFDAPVPYIIGVLIKGNEKKLIRQAIEVNQCYVDLDKFIVESPEEQPTFPNQPEIVCKIKHFLEEYQEWHETTNEANEGLSNKANSPTLDNNNSPTAADQMETSNLKANETLSRVANIAQKAGVIDCVDDLDSLHANVGGSVSRASTVHKVQDGVLREQYFNIKVRETVAASFLSVFAQYDKFIIQPTQDENGTWNFSVDTQDNFDKTSFLSDQPESNLRFLCSFLDTQMFASLVDNAIIAHQAQGNEQDVKDNLLRLFDDRIEQAKLPPDVRSPTSADLATAPTRSFSVSSASYYDFHDVKPLIKKSQSAVKKRLTHIEIVSVPPHIVHGQVSSTDTGINIMNMPGTLPSLQSSLLESEGIGTKKRHLRRRDESRVAFRQPSQKWRKIQQARSKLLRQPSMSEYSPEVIAQTNWKFVEKLLKDVKLKTKKILVGKMGQEAIELGHGELCLSDLEENTWIASLCDLLEKVWSHGLLTNHKKGKSALWSHLIQYNMQEEEKHIKKHSLQHLSGSSPSLLNDVTDESNFDRNSSYYSLPRSFQRKRNSDASHRHQIQTSRRASELSLITSSQSIPPPNYDLLTSIRCICSMRDVQTEVGRSRAWIRLALEQKQLNCYLRQLLNDRKLLNVMYKRYSLLQCDDQCEQFLIHLLSLNAADFTCFTNSFPKTVIEYQVWIMPGRQLSGPSQTTANIYMKIGGEQCNTELIAVPKNCLEFTFKHQNLGVMTTLLVGHDNSGMFPKWLLDSVVARNLFTGQTYVLPCFRWLGRNVDDNSIERLLLAEIVPHGENVTNSISRMAAKRSFSTATVPELQERVGQAVNDIYKYFHHPSRELSQTKLAGPPAMYTKLLYTLVMALEGVFTHGMKSSTRLFSRRRFFAWDVVMETVLSLQGNGNGEVTETTDNKLSATLPPSGSTVAAGGDWFLGNRDPPSKPTSQRKSRKSSQRDSRRDRDDAIVSQSSLERESAALSRMCDVATRISGGDASGQTQPQQQQQRLGKDDMFYLLMLVGIKEQNLTLWLRKTSEVAKGCQHIYEDSAFLCDTSAVAFLSQVLGMLWKFDTPLDKHLLRGFNFGP